MIHEMIDDFTMSPFCRGLADFARFYGKIMSGRIISTIIPFCNYCKRFYYSYTENVIIINYINIFISGFIPFCYRISLIALAYSVY